MMKSLITSEVVVNRPLAERTSRRPRVVYRTATKTKRRWEVEEVVVGGRRGRGEREDGRRSEREGDGFDGQFRKERKIWFDRWVCVRTSSILGILEARALMEAARSDDPRVGLSERKEGEKGEGGPTSKQRSAQARLLRHPFYL